eukprot:5140336-Pyramimonas_sp.AAC.1
MPWSPLHLSLDEVAAFQGLGRRGGGSAQTGVGVGPRVLTVVPPFPGLPCIPSRRSTGWACLLGDPAIG